MSFLSYPCIFWMLQCILMDPIVEIWHIFVNSLYSQHLFCALSICIWLGNSYLPLYIFVSAALSEAVIGRCKELILCN